MERIIPKKRISTKAGVTRHKVKEHQSAFFEILALEADVECVISSKLHFIFGISAHTLSNILTSILQELAVSELNWNEILSLYLLTGVACLPRIKMKNRV